MADPVRYDVQTASWEIEIPPLVQELRSLPPWLRAGDLTKRSALDRYNVLVAQTNPFPPAPTQLPPGARVRYYGRDESERIGRVVSIEYANGKPYVCINWADPTGLADAAILLYEIALADQPTLFC